MGQDTRAGAMRHPARRSDPHQAQLDLLAAELRGGQAPERDALFGCYDLHNYGLTYMRMIRTDRYKLVRRLRAEPRGSTSCTTCARTPTRPAT